MPRWIPALGWALLLAVLAVLGCQPSAVRSSRAPGAAESPIPAVRPTAAAPAGKASAIADAASSAIPAATPTFTPQPVATWHPTMAIVSNTPTGTGAPGIQFLSLHMLDPANGWAVTFDSVLRTADAGRHWANVTPPGLSLNANHEVSASLFRSAEEGWIALSYADGRGPTQVFHTRDAGKRWEAAMIGGSVPAGVASISFVDPSHGWLMAGGGGAMGSAAAAVFRTTDGGVHWTELVSVSPDRLSDHGITFGGDKTGMTFRDPSAGWMTGYTNAPGSTWLYMTRDAGQSWRPQRIRVPPDLRSAQLVVTERPLFFPDGSGLLPVEFADVDRSAFSAVTFYRSTDGGTTWNPTTPVRYSPGSRLVYSFADTKDGWVSDGSKLYRSRDGARTWTTLTPGRSLNDVVQLNFVTPDVGWALISPSGMGAIPRLLLTRDGGQSWSETEAEIAH